jgi:hypothetical protein
MGILAAQLTALHQEVYERSRHQHNLVGFQVTSAAAIVGVVAAGRVSPLFLMVLAFTSSGFNFFWLDHHSQIARLGAHLAEHVEGQANTILRSKVLRWESDGFPPRPDTRVIGNFYKVGVLATFLFPPTAALIFVAPHAVTDSWWMIVSLFVGVLAVLAMAAANWFMLWEFRKKLAQEAEARLGGATSPPPSVP